MDSVKPSCNLLVHNADLIIHNSTFGSPGLEQSGREIHFLGQGGISGNGWILQIPLLDYPLISIMMLHYEDNNHTGRWTCPSVERRDAVKRDWFSRDAGRNLEAWIGE